MATSRARARPRPRLRNLKQRDPEDKGPEDDDEDEDEYNLRIGIGHLDVVNDTKKLSELIYDKRGYFDKAAIPIARWRSRSTNIWRESGGGPWSANGLEREAHGPPDSYGLAGFRFPQCVKGKCASFVFAVDVGGHCTLQRCPGISTSSSWTLSLPSTSVNDSHSVLTLRNQSDLP